MLRTEREAQRPKKGTCRGTRQEERGGLSWKQQGGDLGDRSDQCTRLRRKGRRGRGQGPWIWPPRSRGAFSRAAAARCSGRSLNAEEGVKGAREEGEHVYTRFSKLGLTGLGGWGAGEGAGWRGLVLML